MGAEYRENARNAHKCAQKKYAANVESLQKFTQKRAVMCFGKFEEVRIKKGISFHDNARERKP